MVRALTAPVRESMTIGGLAKAVGVNVETIRYYQRRGLIAEPHKPPGGHRRYSRHILQQLHFIRRAQQLGFTLDEVKELLKHWAAKDCRAARAIAEARHEVLAAQVEKLEAMRSELDRLIKLSRKSRAKDACALFEALGREA